MAPRKLVPTKAKKMEPKHHFIKRRIKRRCHYINCHNCTAENSTRIPSKPKEPEPKGNNDGSRYTTFYRKLWYRQEFLRRIGLKADDPRNDLRICKCHPMEQKPVVFPIKVTFPDGAGGWISKSKRCEFKGLPIALGIKAIGQKLQLLLCRREQD